MFTDTIKRFFLGPEMMSQPWEGVIGPTQTGITITHDTALTFSAVFACINIIADTVASLPFQVFKQTRTGKVLATKEPIYNLLHVAPSEQYTSYTFRYVLMLHLLMRGNAYALINRDENFQITSFTILDPTKIIVKANQDGVYYEYDRKKVYNSTEIIHLLMLSNDGLIGRSPIAYARENIGLGLAAEKYGQKWFDGENIKAVIEIPTNTQKEKREQLSKSLRERFGGIDKSHRTLILSGGAKFNNVNIPLNDAQFIETRKFQLLEIARIYRVPPHKLGELEKSSYSTNEQAEMAYLQDTIRPLLVNIEQEVNRKIWPVINAGGLWAEFNMSARLRGDIATRTAYYRTMREIGAMTADEVRRLENMNNLNKVQKIELERERANITLYSNDKGDKNNKDTVNSDIKDKKDDE